MKSIGIIPARFASTRFPGKPLVDLLGKSMIQRVYEQCQKSKHLDKVIVATDDQRILEHVTNFGGEVLMTSPQHATGTSRCAEVATQFSNAEIIVNIQGDEPTINPEQIDELVEISGEGIATQAKKIEHHKNLFDPNVVKVVFDKHQHALYFSRQAIPYLRGVEEDQWSTKNTYYRHIGLYSFDRNTLLNLDALPASDLEKSESLEQLRWLDHGIKIKVGVTAYESISVDVPADAERIRQLLESRKL
jgi:3-deoxy-manno-octulosonate cytidylyltransferase (CMP-KDO synthetase)